MEEGREQKQALETTSAWSPITMGYVNGNVNLPVLHFTYRGDAPLSPCFHIPIRYHIRSVDVRDNKIISYAYKRMDNFWKPNEGGVIM